MAFMQSVGSVAGKTTAYAVKGTKLMSKEFAKGAVEDYLSKAAELEAKCLALEASAPAVQRKLTPRPVKA